MAMIFIIVAASMAAASGAALRNGRALMARDNAELVASLAELASDATPTKTICGMETTLYTDADFITPYVSIPENAGRGLGVLGRGAFGVVYEMKMKASNIDVAVKIPIKNSYAKLFDDVSFPSEAAKEAAIAKEAETAIFREAVFGLMVCSAEASICPPFIPFMGIYNNKINTPVLPTGDTPVLPSGAEASFDNLVYRKGDGLPLRFVVEETKTKKMKSSWNAFVTAHGAIKKAGALQNLDAALAATRHVVLGIARMQELHMTHNDIKPDNVVVGAAGAKIIDFGLACLGPKFVDSDVQIALKSASSTGLGGFFTSATSLIAPCPALQCKLNTLDGTPGFMSGPKMLGSLCGGKTIGCNAKALRSVDMFSAGMLLLNLLTGIQEAGSIPVEAADETGISCLYSTDAGPRSETSVALSYFIALGRDKPIGAAETEALNASRGRLFTALAKITVYPLRSDGYYNKNCLLCGSNAPMRFFLSPAVRKKARTLRLARCVHEKGQKIATKKAQTVRLARCVKEEGQKRATKKARTVRSARCVDEEGQKRETYKRMKVVPHDLRPPAQDPPKPWSVNEPDAFLLPVPDSLPLQALLDLLRKLLAWKPEHGFPDGDANDAVAAIDTTRLLLHRNDAGALRKLLDSVAKTPGVDTDAHAACLRAATLALKQIKQRDLFPGPNDYAKGNDGPNADDVVVALHQCVKESKIHSKGNAATKTGKASVASMPSSSSPTERTLLGTFSKTPFALPRGGSKRSRKIALECDIVIFAGKMMVDGANAGTKAVWVEWSSGKTFRGMGYFDQELQQTGGSVNPCPNANTCKVLYLLYATPRGKGKPSSGPLTLFGRGTATLTTYIDKMANECGKGNTAIFASYLADAIRKRRKLPKNGEAGGSP
jgi:serine/threonine protein kinase